MISAIIVNYHCVLLTLRAVESILNEKQDVEIWVVDNSVDSRQARQLKQLLPSKVNLIINEYNNGFAQACNQGYQVSRGELILLLNPDAYLVSGCLTVLKRALLSDHKIAAVSPQVYWDDDKKHYLPPSVFPSAWLLLCDELCRLHPLLAHLQSLLFRFKALRVWKRNRGSIQVSALSGGHVLLKRSAVEECGGLFDEQYFMYYEDSDLMLRLKRADYCLCVIPEVACIHNYEHNQYKIQLMAVSSKQYFSKHYQKSLWLKWIKYLPKGRIFKTGDKVKNLGVFSTSPEFNVPESLHANWLLEISPSSNFIPSIGLLGSGETAKISDNCSQFLHAGHYFCRISSPDNVFIVAQKWRWEKSSSKLGPLDLITDQDVKNRLFPVPLSVYRYLLKLEKKQAKYFHYGLFKETSCSLYDAQHHLVNELIAYLPTSGRILIVGFDLEFILKQLAEKDYSVDDMNPAELENHVEIANYYEAIILHESASLIDPFVIFNQSFDFLSSSGVLIVLDEFALSFAEAQPEKKHLIKDFVRLAERFNYKLIAQNNFSPLITGTFGSLIQLLYKHKKSLINELKLTTTQFNQIVCSNRQVKEKYQQQKYSYTLLCLKKTGAPKWRLQHFNKCNLEKMLTLFELSFNQKMSQELWKWKYETEQSREICVWEEEALIAHYGGMPRDILFFGQAKTAVQIGDVMVNPKQRGVLTRNGPFCRMTSSFMECFTGYGKPFIISFGFPSERHIKLAEHLGLYAEVGRMVAFFWVTKAPRPRLMSHLKVIDHINVHHYQIHIDRLWMKMAKDLTDAIVGVRDSEYLITRYLKHPEQKYQLILIKQRWTAQAIGVMVLQYKDDQCDIIDVIAPLSAFPLIVLHARRLATINHCQRVYCQITQAFSRYIAISGFQQDPCTIPVASDIWSDGPSPEVLSNRWWLMTGDMDFR